jgi:pre-rRNA-processing protein TSR4
VDGQYEKRLQTCYLFTELLADIVSLLQTWLEDSTPPPGNFAKCKVCNHPMPLLLQLNGDLPEHFPDNERMLYVFGCTRRACSRKNGSIRALRSIRRFKQSNTTRQARKGEEKKQSSPPAESERESRKPKQDIGASLFGVSSSSPSANANPFSTSASGGAASPANPFAQLPPTSTLAALPPQKPEATSPTQSTLPESFADKLRLSSPSPPTKEPSQPVGPPLPWPEQPSFPTPYPQYYFDAEYETLSRPSSPSLPAYTTDIGEESAAAAAGGGGDIKDAFESSLDKDFLRFSTRLAHNPEQVLRYEFRGSPLLYSTTDAVGKMFSSPSGNAVSHVKTSLGKSSSSNNNRIPRCESCGRERVFELQLVPHAIAVLEQGRENIGFGPKDDAGMEWGTIILGVCAGNCAPDTVGQVDWREEWVGVQWEEPMAGK